MDAVSMRIKKMDHQPYFHNWWCLAFVSVGFLCSISNLAPAQVSAEMSEKFRQASEAMRQGNLDEAEQGFALVAARAPSFAEAHFNLGLVLEEQGDSQKAIVSFQKALALKPHLRGANLFLGVANY